MSGVTLTALAKSLDKKRAWLAYLAELGVIPKAGRLFDPKAVRQALVAWEEQGSPLPTPAVLSKANFARHQGWRPSYIRELEQAGRLVLTDDGRVDVVASQQRIEDTRDPSREGVRHRWQKKRGEAPAGGDAAEDVPRGEQTDAGEDPDDEAAPEADRVSYSDARARREMAQAEMAELDLAAKRGHLADVGSVERVAGELGTSLRRSLEYLPDTLAQPLAVESDPDRVHAVLMDAIETALARLSKQYRRLSDQERAA